MILVAHQSNQTTKTMYQLHYGVETIDEMRRRKRRRTATMKKEEAKAAKEEKEQWDELK